MSNTSPRRARIESFFFFSYLPLGVYISLTSLAWGVFGIYVLYAGSILKGGLVGSYVKAGLVDFVVSTGWHIVVGMYSFAFYKQAGVLAIKSIKSIKKGLINKSMAMLLCILSQAHICRRAVLFN